ncbi:MAG: toxin-activating lysine-acyltransferase [Alphaproteobacteria bacterium]
MEFVHYKPRNFYETMGLLVQVAYFDENMYQKSTVVDAIDAYTNPINLNQCRIWLNKETSQPVAFCTWAFLTQETEDKYKQEPYIPEAEEWNAGNLLWFMDFICPFASPIPLFRDMGEHELSNYETGQYMRFGKDHNIRRFGRYVNPYYTKKDIQSE